MERLQLRQRCFRCPTGGAHLEVPDTSLRARRPWRAFHVERRRRSPPVHQDAHPRCQTPRYGHLVTDTSFRETPRSGSSPFKAPSGPEHRERRSNRGDHRELPASRGRRTREGPRPGATVSAGPCPSPTRRAPSEVRVRAAPFPLPGAFQVPDTSLRTPRGGHSLLRHRSRLMPPDLREVLGHAPREPGGTLRFRSKAGPTVLRRTTPLVFRSESWQRSSRFGGWPAMPPVASKQQGDRTTPLPRPAASV